MHLASDSPSISLSLSLNAAEIEPSHFESKAGKKKEIAARKISCINCSTSNLEIHHQVSVSQQLFSRSMKAVFPIGYFPPISYFAYLIRNEVTIEAKEHFVKQSLRNRCAILGANGPLNLLIPRAKSNQRLTIEQVQVHEETDWKTLHWRSLEAAYRNSPYFEYYEDDFQVFFKKDYTHHFQLNLASIQLVCNLLDIELKPEFTSEYQINFDGLDLRNAWNKQEYAEKNPANSYPRYIQVFSDRHEFAQDLSILDILFCLGPRTIDYLKELELTK
jgi:hypothetical protein